MGLKETEGMTFEEISFKTGIPHTTLGKLKHKQSKFLKSTIKNFQIYLDKIDKETCEKSNKSVDELTENKTIDYSTLSKAMLLQEFRKYIKSRIENDGAKFRDVAKEVGVASYVVNKVYTGQQTMCATTTAQNIRAFLEKMQAKNNNAAPAEEQKCVEVLPKNDVIYVNKNNDIYKQFCAKVKYEYSAFGGNYTFKTIAEKSNVPIEIVRKAYHSLPVSISKGTLELIAASLERAKGQTGNITPVANKKPAEIVLESSLNIKTTKDEHCDAFIALGRLGLVRKFSMFMLLYHRIKKKPLEEIAKMMDVPEQVLHSLEMAESVKTERAVVERIATFLEGVNNRGAIIVSLDEEDAVEAKLEAPSAISTVEDKVVDEPTPEKHENAAKLEIKSGRKFRFWKKQDKILAEKMHTNGYSCKKIAETMNRSQGSVEQMLSKIAKDNNTYNRNHVDEKYDINKRFIKEVEPESVLDLYCGPKNFYVSQGLNTLTNDMNKQVNANYHEDAELLAYKLWSEKRNFDLVDIDPYGSGYECLRPAIKLANKGLVVSFGEMSGKRYGVSPSVMCNYNIADAKDFTLENLIKQVQLMALSCGKKLHVFEKRHWAGGFSRVWFKVESIAKKNTIKEEYVALMSA